MDDPTSLMTSLTGLSTQQQLYATWITIGLKYLSELYSAVRAGGGLKRIIFSFWLGETVPKVIADDYRHELKTEPVFKKSETPPAT